MATKTLVVTVEFRVTIPDHFPDYHAKEIVQMELPDSPIHPSIDSWVVTGCQHSHAYCSLPEVVEK